MDKSLSKQQIEELRSIDTPTISNAIEKFNLRCQTEGFMGMEIRCLFPEFGVMFGRAVTVTVDTTTPDTKKQKRVSELIEAIEKSPGPVVVIMKVKGPKPEHTCVIGDVMGMGMKQAGAVGLVTDGGVRDLEGLKSIKFKVFAGGAVPSHGILSIDEFNSPVEISGVKISEGDLIHGDENGVVKVPWECVDRLCAQARKVLEREKKIKDAINSPDFGTQAIRHIYGERK